MKKFLSILIAIIMCCSFFGCSSNEPGSTPVTDTDTKTEVETFPLSKEINLTTDKGTITFDGFELAKPSLTDDVCVMLKFTFTSKTDLPSQCQKAFSFRFFQNKIETDTASSWNSTGGEQYELCSNYFLEAMSGGSISFGRPVKVKNNSPITLIVNESGNADNFQAIEIDISSLEINAAEDNFSANTSTNVPENAINLTTDSGTIKYIGFEPANSALVEENNAVVVMFSFTNNKVKPIECQNAFQIKYYQNGVEVETCSSWSSNGGDQYNLCSNYFLEVMSGGTITLAKAIALDDNSPVTIIVQENGNPDNYQKMEVNVAS